MHNKKINKKLIIILALLIVLFLVGIAVGLFYKMNQTTDNVGESALFEKKIEQLVDKGTIAPWADQNPDNKEIIPPTMEQLHEIYLNIRKAYYDRDLEQYSKYASPQRLWMLNNNGEVFEGYVNDNPVFSKKDVNAEEFFMIYSVTGASYNSPRVSLLKPVEISKSDPVSEPQPKPIISDFINGTKMYVEESPWINEYIIKYQIIDNSYQSGYGKVAFVNYNGEWKYQGEIWINNFISNSTVSDIANEAVGTVFTLDVKNLDKNNNQLDIKVGDKVSWNNFYGIVYSVPDSDNYWNSPLIYDSAYIRQFNEPGHYTYVITNPFDEIFRGDINVQN